jgi:protein gp37
MGTVTSISWTDHTFNPWIGCVKVSAGCDHCYAEHLVSGLLGFSGRRAVWGPAPDTPRHRTSAVAWAKVLVWNRKAVAARVRRRVFCGSLMDFFEDHPASNMMRPEVFDLIRRTPNLDWQLLTKRPQNIQQFLPADWGDGYANVWLGCTIEANGYVSRAAHLIAIPAVCRFISYEPAIGPLDNLPLDGIDWIIYGAESGPKARDHDLAWPRNMRDRCAAAGVAFFYKQPSGPRDPRFMQLDGQIIRQFPIPRTLVQLRPTRLLHRGDMSL